MTSLDRFMESSIMRSCFLCHKKLSLVEETMGLCKCKEVFCKKHKLPEDHVCSYDHKGIQKENLKQQLHTITSQKVIQI